MAQEQFDPLVVNFWGVMPMKITPVEEVLGGKKIDLPDATTHDQGVRMRRESFMLAQEKKKSNLSVASAKLAAGMRQLTKSNSTGALKRITHSNSNVLRFDQ